MRPLRLAITLFWLATMALLLERHMARDSVASPVAGSPVVGREISDGMFAERWMGIYQGGQKVGWSSSKLSPVEGSTGYRVSERAHMRIAVMGMEKTIEISTDALLSSDFRLQSFTLEMISDQNIKIKGTVEGKALAVVLDSGGLKTQYKMQLKDEPYLSPALGPFLKGALRVGDKIRVPMLEPSSLAEGSVDLAVEAKETLTVMGLKRDVFRVKGSFKGAELMMWVTPEGELMKEESAGLTFVREDENAAKELSAASLDIITAVAVPFNMSLPTDVARLKVRISGIDMAGLELDGGNQTLNGDILEVSKTPLNDIGPLTGRELKEYLSPTPFIQSRDPEIIAKSKVIVGNAKDPLEKARLIYQWVYDNIEKVPTVTIPTSTEVLRSRRGDCNEHTALYTALARAAGVPTRIAVGLVYKDRYFYYHAWPEVYLGNWFAVDPTLGQWPADATHIRLLTGDLDKQLRLSSVVGKIKLEGLEYK